MEGWAEEPEGELVPVWVCALDGVYIGVGALEVSAGGSGCLGTGVEGKQVRGFRPHMVGTQIAVGPCVLWVAGCVCWLCLRGTRDGRSWGSLWCCALVLCLGGSPRLVVTSECSALQGCMVVPGADMPGLAAEAAGREPRLKESSFN